MKPSLSSLHKTESVVSLLIPGPQLLHDMNNICEDFKTVAVNHYASSLLTPDWFVCADQVGRVPEFDIVYHTQPIGTRISPHKDMCDYDLFGTNWWYGFGSASLAFWFSCFVAEKVYVCGADLLQSDQYHFNSNEPNPHKDLGLEWQLNAWKQAPHVAEKLNTEVIIMSGPLKILFN